MVGVVLVAVAAVVVADVVVAVVVAPKNDRFGIGWRPEYAASILLNEADIDIIEVIAENFLYRDDSLSSLKTLSAQFPVTVHCVSLGLASTFLVETPRLEQIARIFDVLQPDSWSEHLAFVRAEEFEIGHLAAPPRNIDTINGTLRNLDLARQIIGMTPSLENIATLVTPPCSTMSEVEWINTIVQTSSAGILLDLHNLLANAHNFSFCPKDFIGQLAISHVSAVHLSGGRYITNPDNPEKIHILDDHLHDVPPECYELLSLVAERCPNDLTVIIERDGNYPEFSHIQNELRAARVAVRHGRERAAQQFKSNSCNKEITL